MKGSSANFLSAKPNGQGLKNNDLFAVHVLRKWGTPCKMIIFSIKNDDMRAQVFPLYHVCLSSCSAV